ncbi:hypothetical protein BTI06_08525 [Lactobacillus delbrueckii subsp. bulgaricus]|nr:hypothetical protein [Lactobacillus delbrueckii subsp. bulgaricus]
MINIGTLLLAIVFLWRFALCNTIKKLYVDSLIITIVVELFIERGYFVQLGSQQISYRTVCEAIVFIISIFVACYKGIKIRKNRLISYGALFVVIALGLVFLILFPTSATGANFDVTWDQILVLGYSRQPIRFTTSMILEIIQLIMFMGISTVAFSYLHEKDWKEILDSVIKISQYFILIGLVEVVTKYIFRSNIFSIISDTLLGISTSTVTTLITRGSGFELTGFNKEASHYVFILSIVLILFIAKVKLNQIENRQTDKTVKFSMVAIILIVIFSFSFSSLYYGICVVVLLLCMLATRRGKSPVKLLGIIVGVALGITILINELPAIASGLSTTGFWGRRINSLVEEMNEISSGNWLHASTALEWSNRVRLGSTYETFKLFKYSPLIGLGFASVTAHSSLAMLVVGCGGIGTYLYILVLFGIGTRKYLNYDRSLFLTIMLVYLAMNIFNSMGFRAFYECWTILLAVSMQVLSFHRDTTYLEESVEEKKV